MKTSIFNKPARTDNEMVADTKFLKKQENMKNKKYANTLANNIFLEVVREIEDNDVTHFTKKEMIELVRGTASASSDEWYIWNKACTRAVDKVFSYFWTDEQEVTMKRLFRYVRPRDQYEIIDVDDKLATNAVFEDANRRKKGIDKRERQIAESAYINVLELNPVRRQKLIADLREQKLINGGEK